MPDITIHRFGEAHAGVCPTRLEVHWLNMVMGLRDPALVDDVLSLYAPVGARPIFSLLPDDIEVARAIVARGAEVFRVGTWLYGAAVPLSAPDDVLVRETDDLEGWIDTLFAGFEVGGPTPLMQRSDFATWPEIPGTTMYLAEIDGVVAGAAGGVIADGFGYGATAATIPAFRRRGIHAAFLARRMTDTAKAGCELFISGAAFASTSQNNMERAGLRLAYTNTQWRLREGWAG